MVSKGVYNFLGFLYIILLLGVFVSFSPMFAIFLVYSIIYAIVIVKLGFKISESGSYRWAILFGSLVLFPIMPFIYYFTYLRKVLNKQKQVRELKQQVLQEIQQESQQQDQQSATPAQTPQ